ncbi:biotin synthase BioB [Micrococcus sp.]|uniref:biotin synthase BioB n=1 Tax=Micrococcus sp. TaxID=1271 RepID=UPI002A919280|nr:biotin synthase BioB [Micrococcus sp.]MDY6055993.1 biotin synthase BioB [Micrococcus sp.]
MTAIQDPQATPVDTVTPAPALDIHALVARIDAGHRLTAEEALAVLDAPDADTFGIVAAASRLREKHFGRTVKVNYLVSLKTGLCPENCTYCSQRLGTEAEILKYTWLKPDEAVRQAGMGIAGGATRVCMVASGTGPTDRDVDRVAGMVGQLKEQHPDVEVCACLGFLKDGQAEKLKAAGVDAYNHNLNTAESHYESICTSHTYEQRVDTVERAGAAGLSSCSGLIAGMGETHEQLVEAVFALRELDSDSIPVNFLMPFDGTPFEGHVQLSPLECLRILAMVRLACPEKELRIAGGREMHLRTLQPVGLQVANSIFLGDYLTSEGQAAEADLRMIADAGYTVVGAESRPAHAGTAHDGAPHDNAPHDDAPHHGAALDGADGHPGGGCGGAAASGCGSASASTPASASGCGSAAGGCCGSGHGDSAAEAASRAEGEATHTPAPALRRRGAGTDAPANA